MDKQIIIINGSGGVGKDTFIHFCNEICNVTNISSVDMIKEAALVLGWDYSKTEKGRKFLSDLKLLSTEYNDLPYRYISKNISKFKEDNWSSVMFIHIREPEEIDRIKKEFDCLTLLIQNVNKSQIVSNMADANVNNYTYDYVISNDSDLDTLRNKAVKFIMNIIDRSLK